VILYMLVFFVLFNIALWPKDWWISEVCGAKRSKFGRSVKGTKPDTRYYDYRDMDGARESLRGLPPPV